MSNSNQKSVAPLVAVLGGCGALVVILLVCGVGGAYLARRHWATPTPSAQAQVVPTVDPVAVQYAPGRVEPLSEALRRKGFNECNPHDPIGYGPYLPYHRMRMGRILVPQKGGHTADMGYDVMVHFHGYEPVRKVLVQTAHGIVYVGMDFGVGSGKYSKPFQNKDVFPRLRGYIEKALKKQSGDDRAHIRHLALSAWSAGYGAINQILKHGDEGIDAVVLLDGLHAGWKPGARKEQRVESVSALFVEPVLDFAEAAAKGEDGKLFIFTHSYVDPVSYPSTSVTADLFLTELGFNRESTDSDEPFGLAGSADVLGFHLWSYKGHNEIAHCSHINHVVRAVTEVIEPAWKTPHMDRNVPFKKVPKWQK